MDIRSRIVSRKIVFVYFYQKCFIEYLWNEDILFNDILKIEKVVNWTELSEADVDAIKSSIKSFYSFEDLEEDVLYIFDNFFAKPGFNIDFDYVRKMIVWYAEYKDELKELVDKYAETFNYDEMDIIDKTIFLLWYIENQVFWTPKKIILNEMIMLSKKYWDESSYKLINWIWHKIIN